MGLRLAVRRAALAVAKESRDWRTRSDLAALLIRRARKLCANNSPGVDWDNTLQALDCSTVDLRLSLFECAPSRSTKAANKLYTPLYLSGAIRTLIHVSDGKLSDVNVPDTVAFDPYAF